MRKIPQDVYYRCIWLVRGSRRLRELAGIKDDPQGALPARGADYDQTDASLVSEDVIRQAERDLECLSNALERIPGAYREGILRNIADKEPFGDMAHPNTWKKWKQEFIYQLAKELHLI